MLRLLVITRQRAILENTECKNILGIIPWSILLIIHLRTV